MVRLLFLPALFLSQGMFLPAMAADANDSFSPCEIGSSDAGGVLSAECRTLTVAEDPDNLDGDKIELHIARLASRSRERREDPLTILAGGPGQSASATFPAIAQSFEKIRKHRDIYLIDQRGTGRSNRLDCPDSSATADPFVFDSNAVELLTKECLAALNGDAKFYTTSVAVLDLEKVRSELQIPRWNIYAISYGTRVALHYLRQYPAQVRTMILDAVVPPELSLGESIAIDAQRALDLLLQRCQSTASCAEQFPDLAQTTTKLLATLAESPKSIQFENFNTGKLTDMEFSLNHLTLTLRMLTYSSHGASLLPVLLNDAYKNDNYAPLARQSYLQAEKLSETLATGMHNSVICTEDQPFVTIDDELLDRLSHTFLGSTPLEALASSCRHWPAGVIDDNFKEPVKADHPVLILSGETDPVTPPAYGDSVAQHLPNSLHIINPGQGHMQAHIGCTPTIMLNFIERGSVDNLDYGCLTRQKPAPFFVDPNGPRP